MSDLTNRQVDESFERAEADTQAAVAAKFPGSGRLS